MTIRALKGRLGQNAASLRTRVSAEPGLQPTDKPDDHV